MGKIKDSAPYEKFARELGSRGYIQKLGWLYFRLFSVRDEGGNVKAYKMVRRRSRRGSKPKRGKIKTSQLYQTNAERGRDCPQRQQKSLSLRFLSSSEMLYVPKESP